MICWMRWMKESAQGRIRITSVNECVPISRVRARPSASNANRSAKKEESIT